MKIPSLASSYQDGATWVSNDSQVGSNRFRLAVMNSRRHTDIMMVNWKTYFIIAAPALANSYDN